MSDLKRIIFCFWPVIFSNCNCGTITVHRYQKELRWRCDGYVWVLIYFSCFKKLWFHRTYSYVLLGFISDMYQFIFLLKWGASCKSVRLKWPVNWLHMCPTSYLTDWESWNCNRRWNKVSWIYLCYCGAVDLTTNFKSKVCNQQKSKCILLHDRNTEKKKRIQFSIPQIRPLS